MPGPRPIALVVAGLLAFAGCGGGDEPAGPRAPSGSGTSDAKQLFTSTCGGCHTLGDAGTSGQIGPDLDEEEPSAAEVVSAIESGPGQMPANLLSGADAQAVADYVAGAAGS